MIQSYLSLITFLALKSAMSEINIANPTFSHIYIYVHSIPLLLIYICAFTWLSCRQHVIGSYCLIYSDNPNTIVIPIQLIGFCIIDILSDYEYCSIMCKLKAFSNVVVRCGGRETCPKIISQVFSEPVALGCERHKCLSVFSQP